jgi:hypothetical protein
MTIQSRIQYEIQRRHRQSGLHRNGQQNISKEENKARNPMDLNQTTLLT